MKRVLVIIRFLILAMLIALVSACDSSVSDDTYQEAKGNSSINEEIKVHIENVTPEEIEEEEVKLTDEELLTLAIEEREEIDKANQTEDGEFYVPLPMIESLEDMHKAAGNKVEAKGLYVTGNIAGFRFDQEDIDLYIAYINYISGASNKVVTEAQVADVNRLEQILAICETTEINALVIDVKNDDGLVKWDSDIEFVNRIESDADAPFQNYQTLFEYLDAHGIYKIGRIVAFKDPFCAIAEPEHTIQLIDGGVYLDKAGISWVNPYDTYIWEYLLALSKEAALRGFDEIQYDYVRFPANAKDYNPITVFPNQNGRLKDEAIEAFLEYANEELSDYKVNIAVDVFAQTSRSWDDYPEDIGQTWRKMSLLSDYICPMIYPSHYGSGVYGMKVPDQFPYEVVHNAVGESLERNSALEDPASIRPWIQGFNAPWISGYIDYTPEVIAQQIKAIRVYGIQEYIIWDPKNTYDPLIFFSYDDISASLPSFNTDVTGRTPEEALERYLTAQKYNRYNQLYLMTPRNLRVSDYDRFVEVIRSSSFELVDYEILNVWSPEGDNSFAYSASVNLEIINVNGDMILGGQDYTIIMEDGVFKVVEPDLANIDSSDYPLGLVPNEMGDIMILMYHNVGQEEDTWIRTPDNLKKDLQSLYDEGYRPIALSDYAKGIISTESGYTPVVITIDDTNPNNLVLLDNGDIDPDCLVGVLVDFNEEHPDFPLEATFFSDGPSAFGSASEQEEKINLILELGMDIGNHTLEHESFKNMSAEDIQEAIGSQKLALESLIHDESYEVNLLSIPYGERPKDDDLDQFLMDGDYMGVAYHNIIALNVGWNPAPSPYSIDYEANNIPRIRASETDVDNVGLYDYIESFKKHPERRFISDGKK